MDGMTMMIDTILRKYGVDVPSLVEQIKNAVEMVKTFDARMSAIEDELANAMSELNGKLDAVADTIADITVILQKVSEQNGDILPAGIGSITDILARQHGGSGSLNGDGSLIRTDGERIYDDGSSSGRRSACGTLGSE